MKTLLLLLFALTGCASMTPQEKRNTWIAVGTVVVVGAITASQDSANDPITSSCYAVVPPGIVEPRLC